jgi:endonuclease/exonuclease/phosphatase family metal-dependent hydrolase
MGGGALRRWLATVAFFVVAASVLTASASSATDQPAPSALRVLQVNLCNSGWAGCYTGRAVTVAAAVIRGTAPDVVGLNEICADDLPVLAAAMRARHGAVSASFQPAWDRRSDAGFRCRNGQQYGIGLLVGLPSPATTADRTAGIFPVQDPGDPEERVWLCLTTSTLAVCTIHLASTSIAIATAQCGYLVGPVLARVRAGHRPAVSSGDFNLGPAGVASCLPRGYVAADDAGVQEVVASAELSIGSVQLIDMSGSTDHPGLLATLTAPVARLHA